MASESFEIPFSADSNLPEINRIKLVDVCDVLYMYEPDLFLSAGTEGHVFPDRFIALKAGASLSRIWFLPGMGTYTEELKNGEHGEYWNCGVSIKVGGDSASVRSVVEKMTGRKFLVLIMDNDSKIRLLGGLDTPAVLGVSFTTASYKGRVLSFSCDMRKQPYFLNSWNEIDLFGVDFNNDFNDDFLTDDFADFSPGL